MLLMLACGTPVSDTAKVQVGETAVPGDSDVVRETAFVGETGETGGEPSLAASTRADLKLKRWRQISLDLQGALELRDDQICNEAGLYDCATLNVVTLGGVSSDNGVFEPLEPGATAGLAIERMVLQACWNRFQEDLEGSAAVYRYVAHDATQLTEGEGEAWIEAIYRRMLSRDPLADEVAVLLDLHESVVATGGDNGDWEVLTCFALGTSTEALTY